MVGFGRSARHVEAYYNRRSGKVNSGMSRIAERISHIESASIDNPIKQVLKVSLIRFDY
jgi:hypothetical protein